jgi:hypothetical protein
MNDPDVISQRKLSVGSSTSNAASLHGQQINSSESKDVDLDDENQVVSGLTLLAIVGVEDPVRPEVGIHNTFVHIRFIRLYDFSYKL